MTAWFVIDGGGFSSLVVCAWVMTEVHHIIRVHDGAMRDQWGVWAWPLEAVSNDTTRCRPGNPVSSLPRGNGPATQSSPPSRAEVSFISLRWASCKCLYMRLVSF